MHQEINKSRHQQVLCMRISASKKHNAHAFISIFHLSLWWSLSICANERKHSSRRTCFDRSHVCSFGNNVFVTERQDWFWFPANLFDFHYDISK